MIENENIANPRNQRYMHMQVKNHDHRARDSETALNKCKILLL